MTIQCLWSIVKLSILSLPVAQKIEKFSTKQSDGQIGLKIICIFIYLKSTSSEVTQEFKANLHE